MNEKYKLILSTLLGIIVLAVIIMTEIKIKNYKYINLKSIFITVSVLGFIMCCTGKAVKANGWTNPMVIISVLLGVLALLLILAFLSGKLSMLNISEKTAFRILYSVIIAKWVITTIHHIINLT